MDVMEEEEEERGRVLPCEDERCSDRKSLR